MGSDKASRVLLIHPAAVGFSDHENVAYKNMYDL